MVIIPPLLSKFFEMGEGRGTALLFSKFCKICCCFFHAHVCERNSGKDQDCLAEEETPKNERKLLTHGTSPGKSLRKICYPLRKLAKIVLNFAKWCKGFEKSQTSEILYGEYCRSRKNLKNGYSLPKIGVDTAENEPRKE